MLDSQSIPNKYKPCRYSPVPWLLRNQRSTGSAGTGDLKELTNWREAALLLDVGRERSFRLAKRTCGARSGAGYQLASRPSHIRYLERMGTHLGSAGSRSIKCHFRLKFAVASPQRSRSFEKCSVGAKRIQ